jgi:predicted  nucleic acid-binding Zn-ribbon protein
VIVMLPDLQHLIALQELELRAGQAQRIVSEAPERIAALDAKLAAATTAVDAAKAAIADNQTQRRTVDKDLLAAQQRLDKYKEQSMAVKTNAEFHAMQQQMAAVKAEIDQFESRTLEIMMAADEAAAGLKRAEAQLKSDQAAVAAERAAIERERDEQARVAGECTAERRVLIGKMTPSVVSTFEKVSRQRGGIGLARAEKERCVVCQVRLRPMVFSAVIRNDAIVQCDSCQRILYYVRPEAADASVTSAGPESRTTTS